MRLDQGTIRDMADVQSSIFTMSITQYFLKHDDPPPPFTQKIPYGYTEHWRLTFLGGCGL